MIVEEHLIHEFSILCASNLQFSITENYMSRPPNGTLILSLLPESSESVIGIDTQFFNVNNLLKGIKLIPPGIHFFHYSDSTDDGKSIRFGWWFSCKEGEVIHATWDSSQNQFNVSESIPSDFGPIYNYMVKYPEDQSWKVLAGHIDMESVEEYSPTDVVSTATPLKEENMVLMEILCARDPHQKFQDQTGKELCYTILQFNLRGPASKGSEADVTRLALDKSWYLLELFGHDLELLLAELEMSFVHFVVLGNLCSCTQWCSLMRLVLLSGDFLRKNGPFASVFLNTVASQIEKLPEEYMGLEVVDLKDYVGIMENLAHVFGPGNPEWNRLKFVNKRFNFDLTVLQSKFDKDNFEVYDMNDFDDDDENAPAIVE